MHRGGAAGSLVVLLLLAGCGAAEIPAPQTGGSSSADAPSAPPLRVPADGLRLGAFGYSFGPLDTFSLPRSARLVTAVDQADNVTAVLSAPAPTEVAAYLRRSLPAAGFTVTGDTGAATLTFTGHGWRGSFTGADGSSAVLLRPG